MPKIRSIQVTNGVYWVEIPEAELFVLCGCPADSVKHLMKRGLIVSVEENGVAFETGPNAILLSDVLIQNGHFSNLAEFPVLQMLYRQGMILPNHPKNTGDKPLIIGSEEQVKSQLEYIYRGNYGLISETEIIRAGISSDLAKELMQMKLKFAFGKIHPSEDLLESRVIADTPVEIKNGVTIQRRHLNIFEFRYHGESTVVDLNLRINETYGVPYRSGFYNINREYFSVIHSGEGDGWDINRPTMSSILMFQGKLYLIDAGPNISYSLSSLGIGINEVEGIFHTHAHDDHFCGLPTLVNSDHKIKYYATPLVRSSVIKKLSALSSISEKEFNNLFDVHDLEFDVWNKVGALEVKPMLSPHPVETNIYIFRVLSEGGYRSYAHFADIVSIDLLENMVRKNRSSNGISTDFVKKVKEDYFTYTNLKKLDIGGGLIHGKAEDFIDDPSDKIILSHTSLELTDKQKEIGSSAPLGMVDVLIPSFQDYLRIYANEYLQSYFPSISPHEIQTLLNNPITTFNPENIIIKTGEHNESIYLILTGNVEMIQSELGRHNILSAGALVGELSGLMKFPSQETYRTTNFVRVLQVPSNFYLEFVKRNGLYKEIQELHQKRLFLQKTQIFGEAISYPIQNKIAKIMQLYSYRADQEVAKDDLNRLLVIRNGKVVRYIDEDIFETLSSYEFFMEDQILIGTPSLFQYRTVESTDVYKIPGDELLDIPIVLWKLLESYRKRMRILFDPTTSIKPMFSWRNEYSVNIKEIDNQHKKLFNMANNLYEAIDSAKEKSVLRNALDFLISYTKFHFGAEEKLMEQYKYPGYKTQVKEHHYFVKEVIKLRNQFDKGKIEINIDVIEFFKDWIIDHILTEDRKYSDFLNKKGVS